MIRPLAIKLLTAVLVIFLSGTAQSQAIAPFITTWQTDGSKNIIIPLTGAGYDFSIDWGDGVVETKTGTLNNITHTYTTAGTYTVTITPNTSIGFPRIFVNNFANRNLLKTITQWGGAQWTSMQRAFLGATQLVITATDAPDLLLVTDFSSMFQDCNSLTGGTGISNWRFTTDTTLSLNMTSMFQNTLVFNSDVSSWNVERVTNMNYMFNGAQAFNQDISGWDVSHVISMVGMFYNTKVFNQDLSAWNVSAVTTMNSMFNGAVAFNSPLLWGTKTGNVQDLGYMFSNTQAFNQDLSGWDVSKVTSMDHMFTSAKVFNQSLAWGSKTGNVTNMNSMFQSAPAFNQDISGWDVSKVTTTNLMFYRANSFNQDMSSWNLVSLTNATQMFMQNTSFNGDISGWTFTTDPAKSVNMNSMFQGATAFNRDISGWNVGRVTSMASMFNGASAFNQDLSAWDVSGVTNMTSMFQSTVAFNQPLTWGSKTVNATNMSNMFNSAQAFNQDISGWDVSHVTNMAGMFNSTKVFNQDLSAWNVSVVTTMNSMFNGAVAFNSPLLWDIKTGNVQDMGYMFNNTQAFNQDVSGWDVSKVTSMDHMFASAKVFNQSLAWGSKTGNVTNMNSMFQSAPAFNQDIAGWNISKVTNAGSFMLGKEISRINYDSLLLGWSVLGSGETQIPSNLNVNFGTSKYSNDPAVIAARNYLTGTKLWIITDGGVQNDTVPPAITSSLLTLNDSTVRITFSERVYNSYTGLSNPDSTDFSFSISGGTATLSSVTPTSISTTDNISFTLGIGLTGIPDGTETITVTPVANSIYDLAENVASTSQSNNTAVLNDLRYPVILEQPSPDSQTVCKNGTATALTISASGTGTLSYQWYSNTDSSNTGGTLISGATSNNYTPPSTNTGILYYYVVVTDAYGSIKSHVSRSIIVQNAIWATITGNNPTCLANGSVVISNPQGLVTNYVTADFSALPAGATLSGNASVTGGECILTPAVSGVQGYLAFPVVAAAPTAFTATFGLRVADGNGADGTSFNYGTLAPGGAYENGIVTGLVVRFIEYGTSRVEVAYNGTTIISVPFALIDTSYRTCILDVSADNLISLSIGGVNVFTNVSLPAGYSTADKSSWNFAFAARCGGANDKHSIKNVVIGSDQFQYSVDGLTWQTELTYSLPAGVYAVQGRLSNTAGCAISDIGNVTLTAPALPTITISGTSTALDSVILTASGGATYVWSDGNSVNTAVNTFFRSGNYMVTGTDADGCANTANVVVTVQLTGLSKYGEVSIDSANNVNENGAIGISSKVDKYGKIRTAGGANGLTAANAGASAYEIKQAFPASADGYYWIKNPNLNGGAPFKIYADMTTDGGGWTLIMCNAADTGWTYANAISLNTTIPSMNSNYSIIGWADYIKKSSSGFQYMIDANTRGKFGGIWTANGAYTFIKGDNSQTDITLNIKFGTWVYDDGGIEERMPWYSNCSGYITTSSSCSANWWGTLLATGGWTPAPWISGNCGTDGCMANPGIIWYWVR